MPDSETPKLSEHPFRELLLNMPAAVQGYRFDGTVLYWNVASERLYGYSAAEAIGRNLVDLVFPDDQGPPFIRELQKILVTGVVFPPQEFRLKRKDGSRVVVYSSHYLVHLPNGDSELFCIDIDLTELRQEQERLMLSEDRFRTLIEAIPDAIFLKDGNGCWQIINDAAKQLFQLGEFPWHGKTDLQLGQARPEFNEVYKTCHADDEAAWAARKRTLFAQSMTLEDGSTLDYDVTKLPIFDESGARKALVVVARDITAQKTAEAELRIAAIAFESQQGMFVTDIDFVILRVNSTFTRITGYSAKEAVGQKPMDLLKSGKHGAAFYAAMAESLEKTGTWQGEIWDRRKNGDLFPEWMALTAVQDTNGVLTNYVAAFVDITARKSAEEQIQNLAFFDALTALPNRRLLMDRLKQAFSACARRQNHGALLFVDLDNFKFLNDTHGHYLGDQLLQQVAQRLSACIPEGNTVARLGGDEFVLMLEDLSENILEAATQAEVVGEKIRVALNQTYELGGHAHHSTPSIGITLFGEKDESIEEPLKRADLAMYQAKSAGRNTLRFFDPQMQAIVTARAALEAGLREALSDGHFELYFQAQVRQVAAGMALVGRGQVRQVWIGSDQLAPDFVLTGVEALLRWRHPTRGVVLPGEFIALAEETGLILQIGNWVLNSACLQLAAWASQPKLAHLKLAVNVSLRQFHQDNFVAEVLEVLARTGANPKRLKLELTESVVASNVEDVIAKMTALKAKGVGFSLDDFGTGYSSLSHLKRLPLDQLKIDKFFVRDVLTDPNDAAIAKMIIALGETLGLSVMAEGVETSAQRDFLAGHGCLTYQGHLYSVALPVGDFEAFAERV